MNDDELAAWFIHHLSEYDNPNDLILEICEKTGRGWTEVQAILERVQAEHEREITLRQSPAVPITALVKDAILVWGSDLFDEMPRL